MAIEPKLSGIYKIVNTINGHKYVGSAVDIGSRWYRHKWNLDRNAHHSQKLQNAWNKYGEEVFEFSVIEECEPIKGILLGREQFWIDALEANGKTGYNIAKVAGSPMFGRKHTKETLEKISISSKNISPETRKKMSESKKGKVNSPETREKISKANKGNKWTEEQRLGISGESNHMYGKTHTPEVKEKLSELGKGKTHTEEHKEKIKGEGNPMYGKKHTEEAKKLMSEAQKNRPPASPETCKKISIANKGHRHTDETRKKMGDVKNERRAERLALLPIVLANILMMLYGIPVDNTSRTC